MDKYACLLTRCNEFLSFAADNAHLIINITIHKKIKRLIMLDHNISANMRIYEHLLSTSVDTLSMVKKADALVIKHEAKIQTAEANLKSPQDLLSSKEWKALISGLEVVPYMAVSPARDEEEQHSRSRDRTPSCKTKNFAFVSTRPSSPTPPATTAASTKTQPPLIKTEVGTSPAPRRSAPVMSGMAPRPRGNAAAWQVGRNSTEFRLLSTVRCDNCSNLGHYATDCPDPKKARADR
jgi:hypothetical protein